MDVEPGLKVKTVFLTLLNYEVSISQRQYFKRLVLGVSCCMLVDGSSVSVVGCWVSVVECTCTCVYI